MPTRNYYQLLGVAPHASNAEIKAAYRKLAMQYHPDKNDQLSDQTFREINEAYTVLSDRIRRAAYNKEHQGEIKKREVKLPATPEFIFQNIHSLRKQLINEDPYRMDKDALHVQLEQLFSAYHLSVLRKENNLPVNNSIIDETLSVLKFLPIKEQENMALLFDAFPNNRKDKIITHLKKQKNIFLWEKYKFIVILLIAIAVCAVIYFVIR